MHGLNMQYVHIGCKRGSMQSYFCKYFFAILLIEDITSENRGRIYSFHIGGNRSGSMHGYQQYTKLFLLNIDLQYSYTVCPGSRDPPEKIF